MTDRTSGTLNEKTKNSEPSLGGYETPVASGYRGNPKEKIPPLDEYWANQFDVLRERMTKITEENVKLRAEIKTLHSAHDVPVPELIEPDLYSPAGQGEPSAC